eukprot:2952561-Prymnesium_polylepis.1
MAARCELQGIHSKRRVDVAGREDDVLSSFVPCSHAAPGAAAMAPASRAAGGRSRLQKEKRGASGRSARGAR